MTYTIREIQPQDNAAVEGIIRICLKEYGGDREGTAWYDPDLGRFSEIYSRDGCKYWVAVDETNTVVGGSGIGPLPGAEGVCELQKMYCLPSVRGTGTAHQLMELCLNYAARHYRTCYLETFGNMLAAQKFYAKHGFTRLDGPMGGTGHWSCDVWYAKELRPRLTIRKASPQDLDAVAELYGAMCDYMADKPFNSNFRRGGFPTRESAESYLAADGLYIAREGGETAGSIALTASPSAEEDQPGEPGVFYIHMVAVHPDHLRHGVASAMLDFIVQETVRRGGSVLRIYVWEGNTPAIRTYEKNGFVRLGKEDIGLGEFGLEWFYLYEKQLDERRA